MPLDDKKLQPDPAAAPASSESPANTASSAASDFSKAFSEFSKDADAKPLPPSDGTGSEKPASAEAPADGTKEAKQTGTEQAKADASTPSPTPSPQTPDKGTKPLDWSKATPEQMRAAYEASEAQRVALEDTNRRLQRDRSAEGRRRAQARETPSTEADQPDGKKKPNGKETAPKLDRKAADEIVADFPQLKTIVDHAVRSEEELAAIRTRVAQLDEDAVEADFEANAADLTRLHPDWRALARGEAGEAFGRWLKDQPGWVQGLARVNVNGIADVEAADEVLKRYKDAAGITKTPNPALNPQPNTDADRRKRQLDGSSAVNSRTPAVSQGAPGDYSSAFKYFASNPEARP